MKYVFQLSYNKKRKSTISMIGEYRNDPIKMIHDIPIVLFE